MEKLSMKTMDIGIQTMGKPKSANQPADVSGDYDFRKMLQSKNEDAQESQNTQDKDQETRPDKTEAADDKKQEAVSKDEGKTDKADGAETDSTKTDTSQTESMIAAQLCERFSYGFVTADQPAEEKTVSSAPELPVELTETGSEELVQMTGGEETAAAQVQTEAEAQQMPETGRVQSLQPDQIVKQSEPVPDTANVSETEAMPVAAMRNTPETQQQPQDFSSDRKETAVKAVQPEKKTESASENFTAEQAAAATARPDTANVAKPEVEGPKTAARVYVEQPEELPQKVTDTLLTKLVEGVKEFEIHIEPANLGKIAVKVLYEGNQATISIICSEKRAMDALSQNVREIGNIIERNLGGETTIIVDKQETDYLNQTRDENEQADQNAKQQKEEKNQNQDGEDAEQFLQKLRLGLAG